MKSYRFSDATSCEGRPNGQWFDAAPPLIWLSKRGAGCGNDKSNERLGKMKKAFFLFAALFLTIPCFSDTIFLKTGQKISGKILEKTDEKIRIEVDGVPLTYWPESIDYVSVEGEVVTPSKEEKAGVPHEDGAKLYQEAFQKVKEPPARGDLQIHQILLDIKENGWQDDARIISLLNDNREAINLFKRAAQQFSDGYILGKFNDAATRDGMPPNYTQKYFRYLPLFNLVLIEANRFMTEEQYQAAQDGLFSVMGFMRHIAEQKEGGLMNSVFVLILENKIERLVVESLETKSFERPYYQKLLQSLLAFPGDQELAQKCLEEEAAYSLDFIKHHLIYAQGKGG